MPASASQPKSSSLMFDEEQFLERIAHGVG